MTIVDPARYFKQYLGPKYKAQFCDFIMNIIFEPVDAVFDSATKSIAIRSQLFDEYGRPCYTYKGVTYFGHYSQKVKVNPLHKSLCEEMQKALDNKAEIETNKLSIVNYLRIVISLSHNPKDYLFYIPEVLHRKLKDLGYFITFDYLPTTDKHILHTPEQIAANYKKLVCFDDPIKKQLLLNSLLGYT